MLPDLRLHGVEIMSNLPWENGKQSRQKGVQMLSKSCPMSNQAKAVVSVSEMARMVGLSRARFYQLIGTTFPWPLYDVASHRPFFNQELQQVCQEVRQHNCGIDGVPLLFYTRRPQAPTTPKKRKPLRLDKKPAEDKHTDLIDGIKGLGLMVTAAQVASAIKESFPNGVAGLERAEVMRAVFLHLNRHISEDNVH
jgi:hypothetical protein